MVGEAVCAQSETVCEVSDLPAQFCCEPKIATKRKVFLKYIHTQTHMHIFGNPLHAGKDEKHYDG